MTTTFICSIIALLLAILAVTFSAIALHKSINNEKYIDDIYEWAEDIDKLIDLKQEIVSLIKQVKNPEYQTLLELRYLCFRTWEQIAVEMSYDLSWVHRLHKKALGKIKTSH